MFTTRKSLRNIKTLSDLKNKPKSDGKTSMFQIIRLRDEKNAILQKLDVLNFREKEILSKKAMK
jgi:hypothetical protein